MGRATEQRAIPHVVVLGGGFGGLYCARALRRVPVRVTLVDRQNYHLFQPLLYQVATAGLQPQDIGVSLRAIVRRDGVDVRLGDVVEVDPTARVLTFGDGSELAYDRLVVAAGAITEDYDIPGVTEHAFGLKSLADATALRNHLLRRFEEVSADPSRADNGTLTFVIAGGGPTGVELAGTLAEIARQTLRDEFRSIDTSRARIVLVEAGPAILPAFPAKLRDAARRSHATGTWIDTAPERIPAEVGA